MEQTIKAIMLGLDADIEGMDPECLRTLSNTFILCILNLFKVAAKNAVLADRIKLNVFDILHAIQKLMPVDQRLLDFCQVASSRVKEVPYAPGLLPRAEKATEDLNAPSLPKRHTFKNTDVQLRATPNPVESILSRSRSNHNAEETLYRLLELTGKLPQFIDFESA